MDEQTKDWVNIDANEAYSDPTSTWNDVLQQHRDAGYTDSQIRSKFDNSQWGLNPTSKYNEWVAKLNAQDEANGLAEVSSMDSMNMDKANKAFNTEDNTLFKPNLDKPSGDFSDVNANYVKPTQEELDPVKKDLRDKYSTDNATFKKMAQEEGIEFAAKSAMKTPMQAYLNGDISKSERDYLIFDAISTAMSNAGNTLLNIAAAYTGGSGNFDTNQKSMWANRMSGVNDANTSALQRGVEGSTQEMEKKISEQDLRAKRNENTKVEYQLLPAEAMAKVAQDETNPGWLRGIAMSMTADFAGNDQDLKDTIVTALAQSKNEISEAAAKEGISVIEYITRELSKIGSGFTSGIIEGLLGSNGLGDNVYQAGIGAVSGEGNGTMSKINQDMVKADTKDLFAKLDAMDDKAYNKRIGELYKGAGGKADAHKLYDYIKLGKLRPNVDIPGIGGTYKDIMKWFEKKSNDEKFLKEHQKYSTIK